MTCFNRVPEALARALREKGFATLTPVQKAVLDVDPPTRDMLVSASTGSGKTVAFGLALAGQVLDGDRPRASATPLAIVITPTRELALQVRHELAWLYGGVGARVVCCTGGMDPRAERASLDAGCEIVVGSPGRLRDHLERGALDAAGLRCVVIDEADDILDLGFRDDIEFILHAAAPSRRTLMFSATVSRRIEDLAARYQRDAVRIDAAGAAAAGVRHEAVAVAPNDRENAIVNLLRFHDAQGALVFCGRRDTVAHLASRLDNRGFNVVALSGALTQAERAVAMSAMRDGRARVCVATDLAARGLDLPGLDLVVHADLPTSVATLTHRCGRTGRAGRSGLAVFVVPHPQRRRVADLVERAGIALHWTAAPPLEAILARDVARMQVAVDAEAAEATPAERETAGLLLAARGAEAIALAYLRQYLRSRPAPELLIGAAGDVSRLHRPRIDDTAWFSLSCGRVDRAEVRWILPLICRLGHVTKRDIGRIVVRERETRFEIAAAAADDFERALARSGDATVEVRRSSPPEDVRKTGRG